MVRPEQRVEVVAEEVPEELAALGMLAGEPAVEEARVLLRTRPGVWLEVERYLRVRTAGSEPGRLWGAVRDELRVQVLRQVDAPASLTPKQWLVRKALFLRLQAALARLLGAHPTLGGQNVGEVVPVPLGWACDPCPLEGLLGVGIEAVAVPRSWRARVQDLAGAATPGSMVREGPAVDVERRLAALSGALDDLGRATHREPTMQAIARDLWRQTYALRALQLSVGRALASREGGPGQVELLRSWGQRLDLVEKLLLEALAWNGYQVSTTQGIEESKLG
jgi:hypothetical protein